MVELVPEVCAVKRRDWCEVVQPLKGCSPGWGSCMSVGVQDDVQVGVLSVLGLGWGV